MARDSHVEKFGLHVWGEGGVEATGGQLACDRRCEFQFAVSSGAHRGVQRKNQSYNAIVITRKKQNLFSSYDFYAFIKEYHKN